MLISKVTETTYTQTNLEPDTTYIATLYAVFDGVLSDGIDSSQQTLPLGK